MAIVLRNAAFAVALAAAGPALAAPLAVDWSHARPLTVIAKDYRFVPNKLTFQPGVAYHLHLENRGTEEHEFHAAEFFKAAQLRDPRVLNADRNEVDLQPGDKKDVYFVAPAAGRYRLYCPDHDWAGMTGLIIVK